MRHFAPNIRDEKSCSDCALWALSRKAVARDGFAELDCAAAKDGNRSFYIINNFKGTLNGCNIQEQRYGKPFLLGISVSISQPI